MKKLFTLLFTFLALTYAQAQESSTEKNKCGDNLTWLFDEGTGTLTISGDGAMYDYQEYDAQPWHNIRTSIKVIKFAGNPTSIGKYAFYDSEGLESVDIPESVTSLGNYAFHSCSSLKSVDIPESVTDIGTSTFGNTGLIKIRIPESVTELTANTFQFTESLEEIILPEGLTGIGNLVFSGCHALKSIEIPAGVTNINYRAFEFCSGITSVTSFIPADNLFVPGSNALTDINKHICTLYVPTGAKNTYAATYGWKDFTNIVELGGQCGDKLHWAFDETTGTLTIIGRGDMYDYSSGTAPWYDSRESIKEVKFVGDPTSIGKYALQNLNALTSFVIPESVTNIGVGAFSGCSNLTFLHSNIPADKLSALEDNSLFQTNCTLYVPEGAKEKYEATNGWKNFTNIVELNNKCGDKLYWSLDEQTGLLTIFGSGAMYDNSAATTLWYDSRESIKAVKFVGTATNIGKNVFSGCINLTSIDFSRGVEIIDEWAFLGCSSLASIDIPQGVGVIGRNAFSGCSSLESVKIPASATSIRRSVFYNCSSLKEVNIPAGVKGLSDYLFYNCNALTSIDIPSSLTNIGEHVFYGCSTLTAVEIPEGVTELGNSAFQNCTGITNIEIPAGVTSIGSNAFNGCTGLTSINIPAALTHLSMYAFSGCTAIKNIYSFIPAENLFTLGENAFNNIDKDICTLYVPAGAKEAYKNAEQWKDFTNIIEFTGQCGDNLHYLFDEASGALTIMGSGAMYNYSLESRAPWFNSRANIKEVTFIGNPTNIGNYAFKDCSALTSIDIPESVTSIGDNAFEGCALLANIELPESVTYLGLGAFSGCSALTEVNIPNSITNLSASLFRNCTSLASIEIPSSVTSISNQVFYGCSALTTIEIPETVTVIDNGTFENCSALTRVKIPSSITNINYRAFKNCSSLTSIIIPASATTILPYAFNGCTGLKSFFSLIPADKLSEEGVDAFSDIDKENCILYVPAGAKERYAATYGWKDFTNIVEINGVCGDNLFWSLNATADTLTFIGDGDMYDYTSATVPWYDNRESIKEIKFTGSPTGIGSNAFSGCTGLTSIVIPSGVTNIGSNAFSGCTGLKSFISRIPADKLFPLGESAFKNIDKNSCTLYVPSGAVEAYREAGQWKDFKNIIELDGQCGDNLYWSFNEATGVLTIIGSGDMYGYSLNDAPWFNSCKNIKEVIFIGNPTSIGSNAFSGCTGLTSIVIPEGVTSIGVGAFDKCTGLTDIEIPESVTSIGDYAFTNCTSLTDIEIPSGVTSIGSSAFFGCMSLTSIVIPEGVTSIGDYAFFYCTSLTRIEIPEGVTSIGDYAFNGCTRLTSIVIPEGVTSIGVYAFYYCTSLTDIVIPSGVTSIGSSAFYSCKSLKSVYSFIEAENLFAALNAFSDIDKENCILYVPAGAKETYAATNGWKDFTNIVELKKSVNLVDGVPYTDTEPVNCLELVYSRTFNNTNWQAWYVPFAIEYDQLSNDFDVAEINNIHQYDNNDDGAMDETILEVIKLKRGTLQANYPYLVRAKEAGEKSIVLNYLTLEAAKSDSVDCSSVKLKYYFVGTASGVSGAEMFDNGYYALSGGALMQAADNTVDLKPFRWYMSVESRGSNVSPGIIKIRVKGETTDVDAVVPEEQTEAPVYYDLSGRRVENPTRGIYIVNGKKVFVK